MIIRIIYFFEKILVLFFYRFLCECNISLDYKDYVEIIIVIFRESECFKFFYDIYNNIYCF